MDLKNHLTANLQEKFGFSQPLASELAEAAYEKHASGSVDGQALEAEMEAIYSEMQQASKDMRPIAQWIETECELYDRLSKRWGGRYNKELAKRIQDEYRCPAILSNMLSAAFKASGAGHDYISDAGNIEHVRQEMRNALNDYNRIVSDSGQGMPSDMDPATVAEFSYQNVYGVPVHRGKADLCEAVMESDPQAYAMHGDRKCAEAMKRVAEDEARDGGRAVLAQGTPENPEDFERVDVAIYRPSTMDGVEVYDTRELDRHLADLESPAVPEDSSDPANAGYVAGRAMPALSPAEPAPLDPSSPTPWPTKTAPYSDPTRGNPFRVIEGGKGAPAEADAVPVAASSTAASAVVASGIAAMTVGAVNLPAVQSKLEGPDVAWEKTGDAEVYVPKRGRVENPNRPAREVKPIINPGIETALPAEAKGPTEESDPDEGFSPIPVGPQKVKDPLAPPIYINPGPPKPEAPDEEFSPIPVGPQEVKDPLAPPIYINPGPPKPDAPDEEFSEIPVGPQEVKDPLAPPVHWTTNPDGTPIRGTEGGSDEGFSEIPVGPQEVKDPLAPPVHWTTNPDGTPIRSTEPDSDEGFSEIPVGPQEVKDPLAPPVHWTRKPPWMK